MSISVMTLLWKSCLYEGNKLTVLLALADWAEDDGGDIFPAIETLAAKCRVSLRTAQIVLRQLENDEVIERIANPKGGRGKVTEYKINLERVQNLQGLHEEENPDCPHCYAKRKSREKRARYRAQRAQPPAGKGAEARIKGADAREHIDNNHLQPLNTRQHSSAPDSACESETVASLGKGETERWPEMRSAIAETWPNGFPADNEVACRAEFERQTRNRPADLVIACARRHGTALAERQRQRGPNAGPLLVKRPSNWLKEGDWQGYIPKVEDDVARDANLASALGSVRRALGDELFAVLRERMPNDALARLDGITLSGAVFAITRPLQRILLEKHISAIERVLRDRPAFTLVGERKAS